MKSIHLGTFSGFEINPGLNCLQSHHHSADFPAIGKAPGKSTVSHNHISGLEMCFNMGFVLWDKEKLDSN